MRLTQLVVQNFRMLRELKLDDLKGLNVFIGPNATGKSTALEAAASLLQASQLSVTADDVFRAHPGSDIIIEGTSSFDETDLRAVALQAAIAGGLPDPPDPFAGRISDIIGDKVEVIFRTRAPRQETARSVSRQLRVHSKDLRETLATKLPQNEPWIASNRSDPGQVASFLRSSFDHIMRARSMFLPTGRRVTSLFAAQPVEELSPGDAGPWALQAKVEDRHELPEYEDALRAFLPHLESLRTTFAGRERGRFEFGAVERGLPGTTGADRWSSGTSHLALTLLGLFGLPEGSVMLIEEPELSLHPYALRRLMDLLREAAERGRIQFFLTTHSPVVTEGIRPVTADHSLWRFSRREDGSADATPCTTEAEVVDAINSLLIAEG